jgi:hypothetical protein
MSKTHLHTALAPTPNHHRKDRMGSVVIEDMVEPSPCPRCGSTRLWSTGTADGPTVPVRCQACGREANACPRCGWEWTGLPRSQRQARRGTCVSCQVLDLAGRRGRPQVPQVFSDAFDERRHRSRLLQRLADAGETSGESRYRAYQLFGEVADRASRRAEVVARLEAGLRQLGDIGPHAAGGRF